MAAQLRIAFMGTPEFSVGVLNTLIASHHDVVCVYCQPPRPKGRGKQVQASPVQLAAEAAGIKVRHPINFKNEQDVQDFKNLNLDVAVVAAYGLILPQSILAAPQYGCINIHASILPRWRGAAPIHRAILAGDKKTGITIMQMDKGLDTGAMIVTEQVDIAAQTTFNDLHDNLSALGAKMITQSLDKLAVERGLKSTPQPAEGMSYAAMLTKEEGHIDWHQSALEIDRHIRALNPWPGSYCYDSAQKRIKILQGTVIEEKSNTASGTILADGQIACGEYTILQLQMVQPENKKPMSIKEALNGGYIKQGDILK